MPVPAGDRAITGLAVLPPARFLRLLTQSSVLVGNSSAGIRECSYLGVPVVVSYHPAYLLRQPADKAKAWDDLCLVAGLLARPPG